jgi:hypothetical protein
VSRVVRVLLSHQVVTSDATFLAAVASSSTGIPAVVTLLGGQIDACGSNSPVSSGNATLDFAREHGRLGLCRVAADLFAGMFPKRQAAAARDAHACPVPMQGETALSRALWDLLRTMCGPGAASADIASSRSVCELVGRVAPQAPDETAPQFAQTLVTCFQTAVLTSGRDGNETFVIAVVELARRFPAQSTTALGGWIKGESEAVQGWIIEAFTTLLAGSEARGVSAAEASGNGDAEKKMGRTLMRKLVKRVSEETGLSVAKAKRVMSLPRAMQSKKCGVPRAGRADAEDLMLGDQALDSLFGDGPPL